MPQGPSFTDPSATALPEDGWYSDDGGKTWKHRDVQGGTTNYGGKDWTEPFTSPAARPSGAMGNFIPEQDRLRWEADRRVQPYGSWAQQDYDRAAKIYNDGALALNYAKQLASGNDPRVDAAWRNAAFAADQSLQGGLSRMAAAPGAAGGAATRAAMLGNTQSAAGTSAGALGAQYGLMGQGQDQMARVAYQRSLQASKMREGTQRQDQFTARLNDERERFFDSAAQQREELNRELEERMRDRAFGKDTERAARQGASTAAQLNSMSQATDRLMSDAGRYAKQAEEDQKNPYSDKSLKKGIEPLYVNSPGIKKKEITPESDPGFATFPWYSPPPPNTEAQWERAAGLAEEASGAAQAKRAAYGRAVDEQNELQARRRKRRNDVAREAMKPGGGMDQEYAEAFGKKKGKERLPSIPWDVLGGFGATVGGALATGAMLDSWANRDRPAPPLGRVQLPRYFVNSPADKKTEVQPQSRGALDWLRQLVVQEDAGALDDRDTAYRPASEDAGASASKEKDKKPPVGLARVGAAAMSAKPDIKNWLADDWRFGVYDNTDAGLQSGPMTSVGYSADVGGVNTEPSNTYDAAEMVRRRAEYGVDLAGGARPAVREDPTPAQKRDTSRRQQADTIVGKVEKAGLKMRPDDGVMRDPATGRPSQAKPSVADWLRQKMLVSPVGFVNSPAGKKKNIESQSDDIKRALRSNLIAGAKDDSQWRTAMASLESLKPRERTVVDYVAGDYGFDPDAALRREESKRRARLADNKLVAPPPPARQAPPVGAGQPLPPTGGILPESQPVVPPTGQITPQQAAGDQPIPQYLLLGERDDDFSRGRVIPSDKDLKTGERRETKVDQMLDTFAPYSFKYKDPADSQIDDDPQAAADTQIGILADNAEKGPTGNTIVSNTPHGKVLRGPQMISALAAAVGRLHERLENVEGKNG